MKKIKRRLLCLLLCVCMCSSLLVYVNAIEPLDGPINADDNATLIRPTLEVSDVPQGAVAIGYNLSDTNTYYYRVNGDVVSLNPDANTFVEQGWMPDVGNTVFPNRVIGTDDREKVEDWEMSQNPYRAIALLEVWYWSNELNAEVIGRGTATMISPNVALTAAHCLYDRELGWPIVLRVSPGVYGSAYSPTRPFGVSYATEVVVSLPYHEIQDDNDPNLEKYDWGLIYLDYPIGNESGYLGFEYTTGSMVTTIETPYSSISGYPGDRNQIDGSWATYNQYYAVDEITQDTSGQMVFNGIAHEYRELMHIIDTGTGQSGSAILYPKLLTMAAYVIRGVHTRWENASTNAAVGITSQMYSFMLAYKNLHLND